ncbi:carbamoyltransferase C-terminal domain-containing protein [Bacillus sp. SM2101]|uniref:carbamoyltransferase C-terminal domain-containing protein n=1 Tax=Bacillus sp. SM2101 TaxID=2805366 RepID=UPI001BDEF556|nr:carbamoyltransferase C-terminal domain-containing protein [Bacillus sp. SM2101]
MNDGYYLATYLHIDPIDHLLDTIVRHDQNIALFLKQGERIKLIRYWELERLTGKKEHHKSFHSIEQAKETINQLLSSFNLTLDDMQAVWGTPGLDTSNDYHSLEEYKDLSYHSITHIFSSILLEPEKFYNDQMIGFAVDGGPDGVVDEFERVKKPYYVGCYVNKGDLEMFPVESPGLLWGWAMFYFGIKEGTLMALASASESQVYFDYSHDIPIFDGSKYFGKENPFEKLYEKIKSFTKADEGKLFNYFDPRFTEEENKISMLMKIIQEASFKIMEINVDRVLSRYNIKPEETHLSMSGGFTLNCPTNSYIMNKYNFKSFIAPPCVGDSGLSLGIGLYAFYKIMGRFSFKFKDAFYGEPDTFSKQKIQQNYKDYIEKITPLDFDQMVDDICESPVVWFNEQTEIGPRALGNRSIISDPRSIKMKDKLNHIKKREWWRPVAPIILEECLEQWFENAYPSEYMLHTFKIKPSKANIIPAVAHLDSSARVQTVNQKNNHLIYNVTKHFYKATGVPIICNTSLNDKGEPIINKIDEAINFCLRKGIKVGYFNGQRVQFTNYHKYTNLKPSPRKLQIDNLVDKQKEKLWKQVNPHNVPKEILEYYKDPLEKIRFLYKYRIQDAKDALRMTKEIPSLMKHRMFEKKNDK